MWKRFKQTWSFIRQLLSVRSLFQLLGWSKYVIKVVNPVITGIVAYWTYLTTHLPWPYLFIIAVLCLASLTVITVFGVVWRHVGSLSHALDTGSTQINNPQRSTMQILNEGPRLSIKLYPSYPGLDHHGRRFGLDNDIFYYSLLVSNEEKRYPNKAYDIKASLVFTPYKGESFEVQEALFLISDGINVKPCYELTLDFGETGEIILAASRGKFTTFRAWRYEPDRERELKHGQWDCTVSLKGINASVQKTFRMMIERSSLIEIKEI